MMDAIFMLTAIAAVTSLFAAGFALRAALLLRKLERLQRGRTVVQNWEYGDSKCGLSEADKRDLDKFRDFPRVAR
jgi:hypothetical protein